MSVSNDQLAELRTVILALTDGFDNVRPIQSRNGRVVCTEAKRKGRKGRKHKDRRSDRDSDSDSDSD